MYQVYKSKQKLKEALEAIGKKQSINELEEELSKIPEVPHFKRKPYLEGHDVIIDTHGLPGKAYLGTINTKEGNHSKF